jgi:dephospho-CoA kinase
MIVLGLTGSIGMGKSTVAKQFAACGVPYHDSDAEAHRLMQPDGKAFPAIQAIFPDVIVNGKIDRQKLGAKIFEDPEKKKALEGILHPLIRSASDDFLKACQRQGRDMALLDIPLLFETGSQSRFDYIICATAPYTVQKKRVLARPGMSEEKFKSILQTQIPDAKKRCWSDFIINTAPGKAHSMRAVKKIIARVRKK